MAQTYEEDTIVEDGPPRASRSRGAEHMALDDPTQSTRKRKRKQASKATWGRFVRRVTKVLLRPTKFWEDIRDEEISVKEIMFPHVIVLLSLRAVSGAVGTLLDGGSAGAAVVNGVTSFVSWLAMIWLFAIIIGTIATARGARINPQDPLRLAAYGLAPLFLVGVFAAVPLPYVTPVAELVAMPYSFHVMSVAVIPLLGVPERRAPGVAGALCGTLLVLWAIMPTLVPLLVDGLMR